MRVEPASKNVSGGTISVQPADYYFGKLAMSGRLTAQPRAIFEPKKAAKGTLQREEKNITNLDLRAWRPNVVGTHASALSGIPAPEAPHETR